MAHSTAEISEAVRCDLSSWTCGIVSDVLDETQGGCVDVRPWLVPPVAPCYPILGRVRTLITRSGDGSGCPRATLADWWASLKPGEIVCIEGSMEWAFWGELCSTLALRLGLAATVVEGLTRDVRRVAALGYPVFARGYSGRDIAGRGAIVAVDGQAQINNCLVLPGAWAFLDLDGVALIAEESAGEVFAAVETKVANEQRVRERLVYEADVRSVILEEVL